MQSLYQTKTAKIVKITEQTENIKLFEFRFEQKSFKFSHEPGQFTMLSLPGFGEAPFAPCNSIGKNLELCVRAAGKLTNKLHTLKIGDKVGIRGPYGRGWPIASAQVKNEKLKIKSLEGKKNLLIVVGGLGLIPLRTLLSDKDRFLDKDSIVQIFYGAKAPEEFLFKKDFDKWRADGIDLQLTVDNECEGWDGCVGLVTALFDRRNVVSDAKAFLCGPPIMYKFALKKVKEHKFKDENIYLSLERRMHCGVGVCQHCAVGSSYTCKDGPVFQYSEIKDVEGAI
ncbi:MAG: FAD/NAD(P)-binding protein [Candidatus Portnoybacteria bacterium]|nr:FAD/NAD(P)-binding protein [Candidatus Portnoybacteria bacterium]